MSGENKILFTSARHPALFLSRSLQARGYSVFGGRLLEKLEKLLIKYEICPVFFKNIIFIKRLECYETCP